MIHKFINQPNKYPQTKPNKIFPHIFLSHHVFRRSPALIPIIPQAYICHGVHGPCPKKIFDTIAAIAPTMKPDSAPNTNPVTIITNEVGCTLGKAANGTRLTAATAAKIAKMTTSLVEISRISKRAKKGNIVMEIGRASCRQIEQRAN